MVINMLASLLFTAKSMQTTKAPTILYYPAKKAVAA